MPYPFDYDSKNVKDNELRKFQPDTAGHTAVNIKSKDLGDILTAILSALGGGVNTTPNVVEVNCAVAGNEYSLALPTNCKKFLLRARNYSKVSFYYSTGATEVLTIEPGVSFEDANFYSGQTIYFKCSKADEVIEVATYV